MDKEIQETMLDEQKKLQSLKDIEQMEGVKLLVANAKNTVVSCIDILSRQYVEKTETEIKSLCATLRANLELYQTMTGIDDRIEAIEKALA